MEINKVAVVGAGVMGSGIAQVIAFNGLNVTLISRRGKDGLERLHREIQNAVNKGTLSNQQSISMLSRISCETLSATSLKDVDLVIESVIEDLPTKVKLFKQIDSMAPKRAILASNTSSLSITALALTTARPDKVVGMHFFNPAPVMSLIEVAKTPLTDLKNVASIVTLCNNLQKFPITVNDSPGFIVNKIIIPMINSAAYVLLDKIAPAETIDSAMKLGANHPIGPLALADLIGLDVCLKIMHEINGQLEGLNFTICPLIEEMVTEGKLGRKTGQGFFKYQQGIKTIMKITEVAINE